MIMNSIGITMIVMAGLYYIWFKYRAVLGEKSVVLPEREALTIESLIEQVKHSLHEISHSQLADAGLHEEEYRRRINQRAEMRKALKDCVSGSISDKTYVKNLIADLLTRTIGLNKSNVDEVMMFAEPERLTAQDRFEIVFYLYRQQFGAEALSRMIDTYDLGELRLEEGAQDGGSYYISEQDIQYVFECEYRELEFREKVEIIVQRIFQHYKGFSVVDEIRDQRIDGVSGGVSGILDTFPQMNYYTPASWNDLLEQAFEDQQQEEPLSGTQSVWIFYKGRSIHLSFLSFGSNRELKRVCQNIYKYNYPGQLSEASGYKVNEMKDGSRVVVVRPPFAESWAFFVRKFDIPNASLEQLITGNNAQLPIQLLQYLMKGSRITAVTGAQGSGKTTLLMAMVKHIYASYTLRVQEMAFELQLRRIYSRRNILSFRETEYISGQQGLDLQKKTDGTVNILGEVASDEVASWMIQMSQVASLFTLFTHHAKTFRDLVFSLRNSLLKTGMFQHEHIAEEQVVSVINFDVHMKKDAAGHRYIERITECIPHAGTHGIVEERNGFASRNVVEYRDGTYVANLALTPSSIAEMREQMTLQDAEQFTQFIRQQWGEEQ
ncbi:Flp pilus assembly complex ATPase component TadA [Paenibacillus barcinonensis]|uniref:Flp pilus assembly complex ATPase component TadA n=1 Tax=Paenibacillus barcinonensis TaxID=198119 RepID=A0A2V4WND7_PAEBA|nr:ATPase, T2SS/T4P/T4SS family [Paenibacillus barcinonensis]PYE49242.1 pilus assembly protein CpaF [Paenibacillus barcinonensis]QKS55473.1 Flp pilus assembly complex ATPase component TadA [Paenibacillus barcinonensis]